MSEAIDLTRDDDGDNDTGRRSEQTNHQEGRRQRQRTTRPLPSSVYVVIHDKEPQDSGSDYRRSAFLPSRQDTKIVGIFYDYSSAARAAADYVVDEFCLDYDEDESDDGDRLGHIDWMDEGWYREEECDANECNDRVHIENHQVK
jgi:hypothetical protein